MSVGESVMMEQFVKACLASMNPRPDVGLYVGTLAAFASKSRRVHMTVRVVSDPTACVGKVCEEWTQVCFGNHEHVNPALSSGPYVGPETGTSSSGSLRNVLEFPTASSSSRPTH